MTAVPDLTQTQDKPPRAPNPLFAAVASFVTSLTSRPGKRKKRASLQNIIENKLETPVFFIVTLTMVIRASQIFSGGQLIMSRLLGSNYSAFEIATGFGLGIGSEMLMTIAGRSWKGWGNEEVEVKSRSGLTKAMRDAYAKKAKDNASWSRGVMFVGMACSLFAGLSYLFTNGGTDAWSVVTDLVATVVVTTCVFYLGVLKENRNAMSDAEEAMAELDEGLTDAVRAAIQRFRDGKQTPVDEKLIAEHLSPSRKAKFLRAVAKINKGKVWTTAELRKRLGIGNDATAIRRLNKRVNQLAGDPDNGLEKAGDNKTWLIPARLVFEEWGEDIAAHDAMLITQRLSA